jgi:pre-mRNA-processing factor 6
MLRPSFLDQEPPPGYIPGIGRGASGFTTRADVGTGRLPPQRQTHDDHEVEDGRYADVDENGVLSLNGRDKEDEEADEIYNAVEERLRLRHKKRVRLTDDDHANNGNDRGNLNKISQQFVDLKKDLGNLSEEQWANLPEVGDLTKRNKRLRQEMNKQRLQFAAPDSLMSSITEGVDISKLTSERERLLGSKIDASFDLEDNSFDQQTYLQEISSLETSNEEEMKRIKTILNSYTKADPSKGDGWIARARLEEFNKNFEQAKKLIEQGCNNCPRDEEVWLENVRLHRVDLKYSKIIVAEGVKYNPKSLRLWLKATELEQEDFNKRRVLRKALEALPKCEELWLQLVELEESDEERFKILTKSLELIPTSQSLWFKLVSIQEYKDARSTLNSARKALGSDNVMVWMRACRLEFEHSEPEKVSKLIKKAFKECSLSRDEWYQRAVQFEEENFTYIATVIVSELLSTEEKNYDLWVSDSEKYSDYVFIMKTILNQVVIHFPKKTSIWRKLIGVYKKNFELEELYKIFENIVELMPKNALFWLMYSKELWKNGDLEKAKEVLNRALETLPTNVEVWCALMKLETISKNFDAVDRIFEEAKSKVPNDRIWYKYVHVLRETGRLDTALAVLDQGLLEFTSWKMFLQKSQILESENDLNGARQVLSNATKLMPMVPQLWIAASRLDVLLGNITRARSSLDLGLAKHASDIIWLEKLVLEQKRGDMDQVATMISKALKEFPESSLLWKFKLQHLTKKSQKKTAYQDALQSTQNHVRILLVIGADFLFDGKLDKARRWFERGVDTDPDFGDAYGWLLKTLEALGDRNSIELLEKKVFLEEPRHGDIWPQVSKSLGAPSDSVQLLHSVVRTLV